MSERFSGSSSLYHLIYTSRATEEAGNNQAEEVARIMATATVKNERMGVTGALLACDGWYVQLLEGRRIDVNILFSHISADTRHGGVQSLWQGPIESRNFPRWGMCASTLSSTDQSIIEVLKTQGRFDATKLTRLSAMRVLKAVRSLQEAERPAEAVEA